ncbi:Spy/CpxP family protein refolding chaperone [Hahella ganghwensis]|uniref:Spy/CpxP family protein refolding chaperone n=1 Tax=Hahella ganghwensis TaxID=286420 RepID=UPI0003A3BB3B|nr:Spy/CpxP family protein refolding chaperone [Hahella ganghwensis]
MQASILKKPMIWLSSMFLVLGLVACRHGEDGRMDYLAEKVSDELEFNEQQNEMWNQLLGDVKQLRSSMKEERETTRSMVINELKSDQMDEAKLLLAFEQHQQFINESFRTVLPRINELHASLSPEQKDTLIKWLEKHRDGKRHFMH